MCWNPKFHSKCHHIFVNSPWVPLVILLHERWNKGCWSLKSQHINETKGFYYPYSWSFVLQSWVFEEIVKKFCLFWQKKIKCFTITEFSPSFLVPQCSHEGSKKDLRGSTKLGCCGTRLKSRQWLKYGQVPSLWMGTWLMWITARLGSYDATNKVSICPCQKVTFATNVQDWTIPHNPIPSSIHFFKRSIYLPKPHNHDLQRPIQKPQITNPSLHYVFWHQWLISTRNLSMHLS